jgi:hypothetical protein
MAKQVNPSKSQGASKAPAKEKALKPPATIELPIKPTATTPQRITECWGGAMAYSDGEKIYWNSAFMQILLSVPTQAISYTLPFQPVSFSIYRENGDLYRTKYSKTDEKGYCSEVALSLPCDPNLHPDENGKYWERYTFVGAYKGTRYYAPSSWTQQVWLVDDTTSWNALGKIKKVAK